jgi:hypothetical protein
MSWNRLKEKTGEEIVKGVSEKDGKPDKEEKSTGSSMKCPSCGAMLSVQAKKEKEDEA